MEKTKRKLIVIVAAIFLIIISATIYLKIYNNDKDNNSWVAYFCPSTTSVSYGDKEAFLVEFDSNGDIKKYKEDAYPITALLNTNDSIIFQTNSGLGKLNKKDNNIKHIDIDTNANTCGYEMCGELKDNTYYFFCNESFKEDYYSSKLIITDLENSFVHNIKGYINEYVNDDNDIYIMTDDEENMNAKIIQRISVSAVDDIKVESKNIDFGCRLEGFGNMISIKDYIYSYVTKEDGSAEILKISKATLEVEDTFNIKSSNKTYAQLSDESVFCVDNKIYCITEESNIVGFDIENNESLEEHKLEGNDINLRGIKCDYFNEETKEYYLLYQNLKDKKYCMNIYDLNGKLKDSIKLNKLDLSNELCPYSIIKK